MKKIFLFLSVSFFAINSIAQWNPQNGSGDVTTPIARSGIINLDGYNSAQIRLNSQGTYYGKIGNPSPQVWSLGWGAWTTDINAVLNWTATGNVGIGTTSPEAKFTISQIGNGWYDGLRINRDATNYLTLTEDGTDIRLKNWGAGGILFFTGAAQAATILNNGNVGIGTTSPSTKLHVNGALKIDGAAGGVVGSGTGSRIEFSSGSGTTIEENWGINLIGADNAPVKIRNASLLVGYTSAAAGWGTGGNMFVQGNVGIGTTTPGNFKLAVNGKIWGTEVQVALTNPGPDYVFEKSYALPTLEEVKSYIDQNKHLPEIPSAKEMEANGVNVGEMNMLLLKKIEELTLYMIEQNKKNEEMRIKVEQLEKQIKKSN